MSVPNAFLPRATEDAQLQSYKSLDDQLRQQALDGKAADRGRRITARYAKYPWLSPGIATAYNKWEEQYGRTAARSLASTAFDSAMSGGTPADPSAASGPASFAQSNVQPDLEKLVATKDFQAQVKRFQARKMVRDSSDDSFFSSVANTVSDAADYVPGVGAIKGIAEGKSAGEVLLRAVPGAKAAVDIDSALNQGASQIPGVGPAIKGISRTAFTAMESPYQEVQAAASDVLGHVVGGFQQAAQSTATGQAPSTPDQGNNLTSSAPDTNGLVLGGGNPFGSSTGAIALQRLINGQNVDLGSGYLPGGEVTKEHERRVRDVAAFYYDHQKHFATPGRIFASVVTEPGSDPYNILSGSLDALAQIKGDPTLLAGGYLEDVKAARKGFDVTPEELDNAGAVRTWWRSTTHGPTVDVYLDEQKKGGLLLNDLSQNYAGKPEMLTDLARRTKWQWPADVYASIINTPNGDRDTVRQIMGQALGAQIAEQPRLGSFSAKMANKFGQVAAFAEIPSVQNDLDALSGPNGSMRSIYNHALGLGLTDEQISTHLNDIVGAAGRVERAEGVKQFFNMEGDALRNLGLPESEVQKHSRFVQDEMQAAKEYFGGNIARGDAVPGTMIDGSMKPIDGPYLPSEYLSNKIWLPQLFGPDGRNRALAKYGRIMGMAGTGFTDLEGNEGATALAESAYRAVADNLHGANTWAINAQNQYWKPVALLRGAWTVRVIGEEQVRMAMAGYDSMFHHPISYFAKLIGSDSQAEKDLLKDAADQGAMRYAQEASFGLNARTDKQYGRIVHRLQEVATPEDANHAKYWADTLTRYNNDPLMQPLAAELANNTDSTNALENFTERFMVGDLSGHRADLGTSTKLLNQGMDTTTDAGAQAYVDGLYDRLQFNTGGDPDLINTVANGTYKADVAAMGQAKGLKGTAVSLDGATGEIVQHSKGKSIAHVLFDDGHDEKVPLDELDLAAGSEPKILSRHADGVNVDNQFIAHLASKDEAIKPANIPGLTTIRDRTQTKNYDRVVQTLFAGLMDIPTTKLSRGPAFTEAYLNELERLLPHMDGAGQQDALAHAAEILHQGEGARGLILRGKYKDLEKAAAGASTVDGLSFDEADGIAKGHGLDSMRELLYDQHKANRTLKNLQLLFPFGEAFKEMIGSWGRIIAEKPITTARKFQIGVNAARGANPFEFLPGGSPYKGRGFFYNDPSRQGAEMFAYPFSATVNSNLFGVPVEQVAPVQGLSMGLNLMPGVGPVVSFPAMQLMNRFMSDPKWDPIREFLSPYGSKEPTPLVEGAFQQVMPSWMRKVVTAWDGGTLGDAQSAKVLNSLTMDIASAGFINGTYDSHTQEGMRKGVNDAFKKAKMLYAFQGTFQFGAPATPSFDFIADPKGGKARRFGILRDAYYKLVDEDQQNNTHDAAAKFINRFGENAMFAVGPKTLGSSFGGATTEKQYDWIRKNPDTADKYPLTYKEFAPPAKEGDPHSYDADIRDLASGAKTLPSLKDWAARTNNYLGTLWYDQIRRTIGLKYGETGSRVQQMFLADKRTEIANAYPGFRAVASDNTRVPNAVHELITASSDPTLRKSNPKLLSALSEYVATREAANQAARARGRIGDSTRPGFASSQDTADLRFALRAKAEELGKKSPQFLSLWQDVFDREMKDDEDGPTPTVGGRGRGAVITGQNASTGSEGGLPVETRNGGVAQTQRDAERQKVSFKPTEKNAATVTGPRDLSTPEKKQLSKYQAQYPEGDVTITREKGTLMYHLPDGTKKPFQAKPVSA